MKTGPSVGSGRRPACAALAVFFLWLTALPTTCSATTYFVDANHPSARDTNPGTEALPFKTIEKATSLVNAGDTVFVKAGIYRETVILSRSGTSATVRGGSGATTITSPITIAAYPGHEGKAIIDAAEPVTQWRRCTGPQECAGNPNWDRIYWANVAALVQSHPDKSFAVRQVFQHGVLLPRSRYPNTGWSYPTTIVDPKATFSDNTLTKPSAYFNGAVCHIKTAMWQIDPVPIAGSVGPTITLAASPRYDLSTRFGYYITSVVGEINEEGEWAYDPTLRRLYLWPKGDVPAGVEFTYRDYCLRTYAGVSFNMVRGLTLQNAYQYGIFLYLANYITIEDNTVEHAYGFGIHSETPGGPCDNNQILRNTVKCSGYCGIDVGGRTADCHVEGNTVYATGVEHFGGDLLNGPSRGIQINGTRQHVYNNRIDRTGSVGLYLYGEARGREISYNYITDSGLALSDTGGLYTGSFADGPETDHIHHNIVENSLGCRTMDRTCDTGKTPTIETYAGDAHGIYVDEEGNNRIIEDNTVIGSSAAGIFFHWAFSNLVQRNTLYGNGVAQVWLSGKNAPRTTLVDDVFLDNILFATDAQQRTLYLGINYDNVHFGRSDRNYFYNPYNENHILVSRYSSSQARTISDNLTLRAWYLLSRYDGASREFSYLEQLPGISLAEPRTSRIVYNPTLDMATVDLAGKEYCDVQGNKISGSVVLQPFESRILIALGEPAPEPEEQTTDGSAVGNPF
jgi:parallel beta-helix repeat protein